MTCIVGLEWEGRVLIGADSIAVAQPCRKNIREDRKVFFNRSRTMIFGFTSSFRAGQVIQYRFRSPGHPERMSDHEYLSTIFIDEIKRCLRDNGTLWARDSGECGPQFLLGYSGKLYDIDTDFQVGKNIHGYSAIGSGRDVALGSLYTSDQKDPIQTVETALGAASEFCSSVSGPFHIETL